MDAMRRHLMAALAMLVGSSAVFGFLMAMNAYSTPPPPPEKKAAAEFKVEKKKEKKKKKNRPKPKPKRTARASAPRPSAPNIGSGMSSVDISMPGFDMGTATGDTQALLGDVKKNVVMDENSVDEPPKAITRVAPDQYPQKAREKGIEGFVKMNLLIGETGDVERVKVLQAEPPGVFDDVALATIRRWRFEPAVYQAQHVRVWATQTMRFQLN